MSKRRFGDSDLGYQLGLLSFIRTSTLLRLTHRLPTLAPSRLGRTLGIAAGGWVGAPLQLAEWTTHRHEIDDVRLDDEPVFIIGHWRSGTTHLHNLMSHDDRFGCMRMFEALAPDCSVANDGWLRKVLSKTVPEQRPMDNMTWPMDAPQEEEIPLAKVTPYSWYLQFLFPQQAIETFERYVLLNGAPARARREFKRKYLRLLKVAALHDDKRRLLLKNPVNTARIPLLLELFPRAKFVFIHRSPYEVFPSSINLHKKILELTALQKYNDEDVEKNVLEIYRLVMERYDRDAAQIPDGQLIEIGYQEVVDQPLETLGRVYDELDLGGFDKVREPIAEYLASIEGYKRNAFTPLSDRVVELINREWAIGFDRFGYERRSVTKAGEVVMHAAS